MGSRMQLEPDEHQERLRVAYEHIDWLRAELRAVRKALKAVERVLSGNG